MNQTNCVASTGSLYTGIRSRNERAAVYARSFAARARAAALHCLDEQAAAYLLVADHLDTAAERLDQADPEQMMPVDAYRALCAADAATADTAVPSGRIYRRVTHPYHVSTTS
ncbi:hypothetical protein PUR49_11365 [Streptomyces sp. BE147]|uniref:hypothetical protein n=1 Tax=Streptomyces sp. BE147 TaxID=3002524 RepID=UPI002E75D22C|nr:hypothetical protein [Streptomyces sp. BE147]MEE1737090.1 hypothetical protein [Streptomyces sp. BE147]